MISLISTGDLHIGKHKYGQLNPKTGFDTSVESVLKCLDHLVHYAIRNAVQIVAINGDLSKGKTLSEQERSELYKRIKKLNKHGITAIILKGNHDGSFNKANSFNIRSLKVLELKNTVVVDEPQLIQLEQCYIIAMPYIDSVATWVEEYKNIRKRIWGTKKKIIVLLHGNVQGIKHHFSELNESEEPLDIPTKLFKNDEAIIAVCCAHQHEYQVISNQPYTFYSGSLDRVTFAERKQIKGFVHLRYQNGALKKNFIEVEAKKFIQILVDGKSVPNRNYKGAVVKVIALADEDKLDYFDIDYIKNKITELGADFVSVKKKVVENTSGSKSFNVSKSSSPKKRIAIWVDKNVDKRDKEQVKKNAIEILEESLEER